MRELLKTLIEAVVTVVATEVTQLIVSKVKTTLGQKSGSEKTND